MAADPAHEARDRPPAIVRGLGFVLGAALFTAIAGGVMLIFQERFPFPIQQSAGFGIAVFAAGFGMAGMDFAAFLHRSRAARRFAGGTLAWAGAVALYVWIAEPFPKYINFRDGLVIAQWVLIPPLLAGAAIGVRALIARRK